MKHLILIFPLTIIVVSMGYSQGPIRDTTTNVQQVILDPKAPWTSTGILIQDTIYDIHVLGIGSSVATAPFTWSGPDGNGFPAGSDYALPNFSTYSVVGKIGAGGTPFYIGSHRRFKSLVSPDTLYLGYNDKSGFYFDNGGLFVAEITKIATGPVTGVAEESGLSPTDFTIHQNYPNPFNPSTTIEYQIAKQGHVEVNIYDINGRLVKTVQNGLQYPGSYSLVWNGKDDDEETVSSGTYLYQVKSDGTQLVKRMFLVK